MAQAIVFYLCPGFQMLDLAGPLAALEIANRLGGAEHYRFRLVSRTGGTLQSSGPA